MPFTELEAALYARKRKTNRIELLPKIKAFLDSIARNSIKSKKSYSSGLALLQNFLNSETYQQRYQNQNDNNYICNCETILEPLSENRINIYELFDGFVSYILATKPDITPRSIALYLAAIRSYFAFYDIDVIPSKFRRRVKVPRLYREDEEPLDSSDIRKILLNCNNRRLKCYLLTLASGAMRAVEATAIRLKDIDFSVNPTRIHIRKEYAKTRVAGDIYISDEATQYLKQWIDWKYRDKTETKEKGGVLLVGLPAVLQQHLQYFDIVLNQIGSIKLLFALYSVLGIVLIGIYLLLSQKIEVQNNQDKQTDEPKQLIKMSSLTPKSRSIVLRLSGLFAIDSFAGGFMIQSIVSFWFFTRFGADLTTLSYIFSVSGVLTAFSFMAAAKIADRIGLINTMVFTHIPANLLIIAVAFAPTLPIAVVLYLLRMALSQMDVPTRQSYIVAVVREDERTVSAGITNISRNVTQAISPSLIGILINYLSLAAPFVIGGALKVVYDVALFLNFRNIKPPEEKGES